MTGRTKVLLGAVALVGIAGFILWRTVRLKGTGFRGYPTESESPSSPMREPAGYKPKAYPKKLAKPDETPEFIEKNTFYVRTKLHREPDWTKVSKVGVGGAEDVYRLFKYQGDLPQEEMVSLCLSNANTVQSVSVAHRGDPTMVMVNPADLLRPCVLTGATRMILLHNHPTGNPTPSPDDVAVTERINKAGTLLGIPVLDHVVIGHGSYSSLRELGLLRGGK